MNQLIIMMVLLMNVCLNGCCVDDVEFIEKYGIVTSGIVLEKNESNIIIEVNGQLESWYIDNELNDLKENEKVTIVKGRIISNKVIKELEKSIDNTSNKVYN